MKTRITIVMFVRQTAQAPPSAATLLAQRFRSRRYCFA